MSANAWGREPDRSVRFWRNHVRVAITPTPGTFSVACGLFNEHGADDSRDLRQWTSHDVTTMESALAIAHAALERAPYVWSERTAIVEAKGDRRRHLAFIRAQHLGPPERRAFSPGGRFTRLENMTDTKSTVAVEDVPNGVPFDAWVAFNRDGEHWRYIAHGLSERACMQAAIDSGKANLNTRIAKGHA